MLKAALGLVIGVLIVVLFLILRPDDQQVVVQVEQPELPWWRRYPYGWGRGWGRGWGAPPVYPHHIPSIPHHRPYGGMPPPRPYGGGWGGGGWGGGGWGGGGRGGHSGMPPPPPMMAPPSPRAYAGDRTATIYVGTPVGAPAGGPPGGGRGGGRGRGH